MKKTYLFLLFSLLFVSCRNNKNQNIITVGATLEPHGIILKQIEEDLASQGYKLKIKIYSDYITPNEALEYEQIDANFFQHVPYMNSFNSERGYDLVDVAGVIIEPMGIYSNCISSLNQIKNDFVVAIPEDITNKGRALLLLENAGLIELDKNSGLVPQINDIIKNPKKLKFRETDISAIPGVLDYVELGVMTQNFAISAGYIPLNDSLYLENYLSPYVNVLTVKKGHENDDKIIALKKSLTSDLVKDFIKKEYSNGEIIWVF